MLKGCLVLNALQPSVPENVDDVLLHFLVAGELGVGLHATHHVVNVAFVDGGNPTVIPVVATR